MSYQAFNLKTAQLPAPTSNMTKAEYKNAYGIDLDNIDIHKFTLILFGKEKYAIDKIESVEGGYEIYFNGRILSITNIIQTSDKIYDVANSKPIYCHPIEIYKYPTGLLTGLIFNNSSAPLDTWDKVKNAIFAFKESGTRTLHISGAWFTDSNKAVIASCLSSNAEGTKIFVVGYDVDGVLHSINTNNIDITDAAMNSVTDNVNKIN